MRPSELFRRLIADLERLKVRYLITGSMATIIHGEPRFTNDIDVVVELPAERVDDFCVAFPSPEYYCPKQAVVEAVRDRFVFNILHPASGLKVDVFIAADDDFDRSRLQRAVRLRGGPDFDAWFASPEDVILKKLVYYQEGESEKHVRDILGVLKLQGDKVDRGYIEEWAARLGVVDTWRQVLGQSND
jgi:hypothetical protein